MGDGSSGGGGGFKPFEGGALGTIGQVVGDEASAIANTAKKQLGMSPVKNPPKNLPQTRSLQEKQKHDTQNKKDAEDIAKINSEIQQIIREHHDKVQQWDQKMIEDEKEEEKLAQQQEEQEELQRKEEEEKKMAAAPSLPGGKKPQGMQGGKQKTPMVVSDAVQKEIGRQKKG